MSRNEMVALIEAMNTYDEMAANAKEKADAIRETIKAEMMERDTEELIAGQYVIRWTSVLSNRFDSTAFKKVMPEIYKAYTKQTTSRRFSVSM